MVQPLNFKTSFIFPPMARYLGFLISIIGLFGVLSIGVKSLIILIVGLGVSFTRYGVLIDVNQKRLKEYTSVYWIKFGNWEPLENYPYLTVLEIIENQAMYSRANVKHSNKGMVFRITLLNENHYLKLLLKTLKDKDLAHKEAEEIADKIKVEKMIYSPGYEK